LTLHRRKWLAGALAVTVASSVLALPAWTQAAPSKKIDLAHALANARRQQLMHQLETYSQHKEALLKKAGIRTAGVKLATASSARTGTASTSSVSGAKSPSSASVQAQSAATSVTYSGNIAQGEIHLYNFTVETDSQVHITNNGSSPNVVFALVSDAQKTPYQDGDTLPAGNYDFMVKTDTSQTPVQYSFTISGVSFYGTPDNKLPNLNVTISPSPQNNRLPQNTASVTVSGSHDAMEAELVASSSPAPIPLEQSFSKNLSVKLGENIIEVQAYTGSGNAVFEKHDLTVPGVQRIAGANRYEVAANISKEMFPGGTGTVIITRGDLFTDALSGGALASLEGAPILLADYKTQTLPTAIQNEIKRLKADRAIILGGPGSVSTNVENQLKALGVTDIQRIAGKNRFDVSAQIADRVFSAFQDLPSNQQPNTAIVASGLVFPDALSASSPSGYYMMPILQVTKDTVPTEIDNFIKTHTNVKNFIIVGGPGTVSTTVESKLNNIAASQGGIVERISGANRFEVSVNTAKFFGMDTKLHVFASGLNFPDALSGGPFAAFIGAPMMLTPANSLPQTTIDYLNNNVPQKDGFYILGGTGSVSATVESQLKSMVK
jgi:putative cell wall-binding protein